MTGVIEVMSTINTAFKIIYEMAGKAFCGAAMVSHILTSKPKSAKLPSGRQCCCLKQTKKQENVFMHRKVSIHLTPGCSI